MSASREAEQLAAYAALARRWNPAINLVAAGSLDDFEIRHVDDSAQLADLAADARGDWLDMGSGGGLPGVVLAIRRPDLAVELLESDQRKCAFLRNCIRELGLTNCRVTNSRIEARDPAGAAQVSARALAPLDRLMPYLARHMAPSGTAWLMKGLNWRQEVETVRQTWQFDLTPHDSRTQPGAAILQIRNLRHD